MEERTRFQRHQAGTAPVSIFAPSSMAQRVDQSADVMRSSSAVSAIGHDFSRISILPPDSETVSKREAELSELKLQRSTEGVARSSPMPSWGHHISQISVLPVQRKLTVGQPNDPYEQEADRVAEQVMSMPDRPTQQPIQRETAPEEDELQTKSSENPDIQQEDNLEEEELQMKAAAGTLQREAMPEEEEALQTKALGNGWLQREDMPEEEEVQMKPLANTLQRQEIPEEEAIQTKASLQRATDGSLQAGGNLESRLNSSKGGGSPLSQDVKGFMESRFRTDFSQVRVHTNSEAVQMNRDLNAQAFTHKQDVYFGAGKTPRKDALTAHELTHVVQQMGTVQTKLSQSEPYTQQKCSECEKEEATLSRKIDSNSSSLTTQPETIDSHNLTSPRFAGDSDLEACYDDKARLTLNDMGKPGTRKIQSGSGVRKVKEALVELGYLREPADESYTQATWDAVKALKKDQSLGWEDMGDVGPGTMNWLDNRFQADPSTPPETTPPELDQPPEIIPTGYPPEIIPVGGKPPKQRSPTPDEIAIKLGNLRSKSYSSHDDYYNNHLVDDEFLGIKIKKLDPEMWKSLKAAEDYLKAQGKPTHYTAWCSKGEKEKPSGEWCIQAIGGGSKKGGLHLWGLAMDIDSTRNPHLMFEEGEQELDKLLKPVYEEIAQFMLKRPSIIPQLNKDQQGKVNTLYDLLLEESIAMKKYFSFMANPQELTETLLCRDIPIPYKCPVDQLRESALIRIRQNYEMLGGRTLNGEKLKTHMKRKDKPGDADRPFQAETADPAEGFLHIHKDIVLALTKNSYCPLRWGGLAVGDIMHFDAYSCPAYAEVRQATENAKQQIATETRPV